MKVRTWLLNPTFSVRIAARDSITELRSLDFKVNQIIAVDVSNVNPRDIIHISENCAGWVDYDLNNKLDIWCKKNCKGKFSKVRVHYFYAFELYEDAFEFKMLWGPK